MLAWFFFLLGFLFAVFRFGTALLNPLELSWLFYRDMRLFLTGWLHFYQGPWELPLGRIPSLMSPHGTTLGMMDSLPWFSIFLKAVLPSGLGLFQCYGWYLAISYGLMGFFGFRLLRVLGLHTRESSLLTLILMTAPPMLWRFQPWEHIALSSHWLLLAALEFYYRTRTPGLALWKWVILVSIACGTHFYPSVFVLAIAVVAHLGGGFSLIQSASRIFTLISTAVFNFWVLGFFSIQSRGEGGFGHYISDVLAFLNPMEHSLVLPGRGQPPGGYEGYAYLGFGVLVLGLIVLLTLKIIPRRPRLHLPLLVLGILFFLFSTTGRFYIFGHKVLDIGFLFDPFPSITSLFRSTARFNLVLYYTILVITLSQIRKFKSPTFRILLSLVITSIQISDIKGLLKERFELHKPPRTLVTPEFEGLKKWYDEVRTLPLVRWPAPACWHHHNVEWYLTDWTILAAREGLSVASGRAGRFDYAKQFQDCEAEIGQFLIRDFKPRVIYLVDGDTRDYIQQKWMGASPIMCDSVRDYEYCVRKDDPGPLAELIRTGKYQRK